MYGAHRNGPFKGGVSSHVCLKVSAVVRTELSLFGRCPSLPLVPGIIGAYVAVFVVHRP